jgi:riboflavin synthase
MFTGLIEETGVIESIQPVSWGLSITIRAEKVMNGLGVDDSVAVNGICLTVEKHTSNTFTVTAVQETLNRTSLERAASGDTVNLERAMRLSDRLDGHIVQGHVDGLGQLESIKQTGVGWTLTLKLPDNLMKYVIEKGSIAIDGISLTIASVKSNGIEIAVIPHTYQSTNLKTKKAGDPINIETDLIGKYVERMLGAHQSKPLHSENWYRSQGY